MLPSIVSTSSKKNQNKNILNENQTINLKEQHAITIKSSVKRKKKIWMDQNIPQNIDEIYDSCSYRLEEIKKELDIIDVSNCLDIENLFDTLNFYSIHLHDLKDFMGVNEIKSFKAMKHIIDVVKSKVKTQNELLKTEKDKKKKFLPDLYDKHKIDEFDEEFIQIEQEILNQNSKTTIEKDTKLPVIGNIDQTLQEGQLPKSASKFEKAVITQDPIITPILIAHRNRKLIIDQVTEDNTDILSELVDKIQESIQERYRNPIEEIDGISKIFEKYLLSFLLSNSQNFLESKVKNDETELDTYNRNLIRYVKQQHI